MRWPEVVEARARALTSEQGEALLRDAGWQMRHSWEHDEVWLSPVVGRRLDFGEALRLQLEVIFDSEVHV